MSETEVIEVPRGGRRKFSEGARVRGKEEGPGSFRGRTGTVTGYERQTAEYKIEFDDGRVEYAPAHWLDAA